MKYFLIGIKGSGMAALAGILQDDGYRVEGIDEDHEVFTIQELAKRGIKIHKFPKDSSLVVNEDDFVIIGHSFINHQFTEEIKKRHILCMEYHEFIAKYFQDLYQVAICGSHGKTTTVGFFYHALKEIFDVSMLRGDGVGKGGFQNNLLVFEACEYKEHFLAYHPNCIVITNIDYDHVDYFVNKRQYNQAFNKFVKNTKSVIINYADRNKIHHKNKITYGFEKEADYCLNTFIVKKNEMCLEIYYHQKYLTTLTTALLNKYNLEHVLCAFAFIHSRNFDYDKAFSVFKKLPSIGRRFQLKISNKNIYIDDYAHHPSQILASLSSAKLLYPSYRYVAIFKPDRYSRLKEFAKDFKKSLVKFAKSYVLSLYEDTNEFTDDLLVDKNIVFIDDLKELAQKEKNQPKTVYLFMSSKNIDYWIYGLEREIG